MTTSRALAGNRVSTTQDLHASAALADARRAYAATIELACVPGIVRALLDDAFAGELAPGHVSVESLGGSGSSDPTAPVAERMITELVARHHREPDRLTRALLATRGVLAGVRRRLDGAHAARARLIVEATSEGVWIIDEDHRTTFMNERLTDMLGRSADDVVGRHVLELLPERERAAAAARLARRARGERARVEVELERADGTTFPVLLDATPVLGEDGEYRGALAMVMDVSELRTSEARYRALFEDSPLPKWLYDTHTLRFLVVNDAAVRRYGWTRDEMLGMTLLDIRPEDDRERASDSLREPRTGTFSGVSRHRARDGTVFDVEITAHFLPGGEHALVSARDITERQRLEDQLRQAQKMEAIGALAGGVAHDFNNLLTVILGYTGLLAQTLPAESAELEDVAAIENAGRRASDLTRQLLAFSRQQVLSPRVVRVPAVVEGMNKMLVRLLGETIMLRVTATSELRVLVDPGQLEQIVMNLVVNARDAMPSGGVLTIESDDVNVDEAMARYHGLQPGAHVRLRIRDDGTGMDRATQARIFEPFFTTKPKGKGTGLGLSTVFGIVKQSGGAIVVESAVGKGTMFDILLPTTDRPSSDLEEQAPAAVATGTETVLVVEDDEPVRVLARAILERKGYHVLEAASGGDALVVSEQYDRAIHLLLTDVVMPHIGGRAVAERLVRARPQMRVLYMSGYADDTQLRWNPVESNVAFIQKPLTPATLAAKVREVLDAPPSGGYSCTTASMSCPSGSTTNAP